MAAKMQIIATTRRLCKAKATRRSIIEEHSALYDHAIADLETALDHGLVALLEADLDRDGREGPRRHFDEHLIGIVFEHQSCRRDRKSTRLNSSHSSISYAVFCLK